MTLSEIAIAFKNCNGDVSSSFKELLIEQDYSPEELELGVTIEKANNHILRDIDFLINKSILNIGASDLLIKKGYFHWGFVTSYYSNFFSIQSLNRLMLSFNTWTDSGIDCVATNYYKQELSIKSSNSSGGSHESQYNRFYANYKHFRYQKSIDRYWNMGIQPFKLRPEAFLRNEINYQIYNEYFYELNISKAEFDKIIEDNKLDLSKNKPNIKSPVNYSLPNLELALSRLRVTLYILNYIANANTEYKSYYLRNNRFRINKFLERYPKTSSWIVDKLTQWFEFQEIETDNSL